MKSLLYILAAAALAIGAASCRESSDIGNSLADESIAIVIDSAFTVTGSSQLNPVVMSRTTSQLIGAVDAPGFGSIKSDFVGQFMPSLRLDTADITPEQIDSIKLFLFMKRGEFVGDSLVPMGIEVYRLNRDLPYPIYSSFDPAGYYEAKPLATTVYTASTLSEPDSVQKLTGVYTSMPLPLSLAKELYQAYLDNPTNFTRPEAFAKNVFKGVYIRTSYGAGRITDFSSSSMRIYYHKEVWNEDSARYDLKKYNGDYFAVTPEVVVNNNIRYDIAPELKAKVAAGHNIIAAPAGYEVELKFPIEALIASYNKYADRIRVVNTITMTLPVEVIENKYDITPPPYILMVLKSKKDEFFAKNELADKKTSFYATYDATHGRYTITGLRQYFLDMLAKKDLTPDDYTFIVTPVQVNLEAQSNSGYGSTTYVETSIVPYVSKPAMGDILLDKAKITFTFSAGNKNNL